MVKYKIWRKYFNLDERINKDYKKNFEFLSTFVKFQKNVFFLQVKKPVTLKLKKCLWFFIIYFKFFQIDIFQDLNNEVNGWNIYKPNTILYYLGIF